MAIEDAMALANRLLAHAQALAAVTAYLRAQEQGTPLDPELGAAIERVIDALDARDAVEQLTPDERAVVVAFSRSYLHQALELIEEPDRSNTWSHSDPTILQAQGAASAIVARLIVESGLGEGATRILDIGTGVGGLAIAFCKAFPNSTVVGLDPWEPALAIARDNVRRAGLEERITLLPHTIQDFADTDGFDVVWLPSFFIPPHAMQDALEAITQLLRPGGTLVTGVIERPDDNLADAVDTMITIRSGGSVLEPAAAIDLLTRAGFTQVREAPRTWQAPLRLVTARKIAASGNGPDGDLSQPTIRSAAT